MCDRLALYRHFFVLIKGWWKDARFGRVSYAIGVVLGAILIYQSILTSWAIVIIKVADSSEPALSEIVNQYSDNAENVMTKEESDRIIKDFALKNPFVAHYIDSGEFEGYTAKQLPYAIVLELKSHMEWFIVRRILWSLSLAILSAVLVIKTMSRQFVSRDRVERNRQRVSRRERARVSYRRK